MKWKEGGVFEKAPSGSHLARCYALIDLGTQPHTFQGEARTQRDVRLSFELPYSKMTGEHNAEMKGKPYSVHLTVKQSLHPMSRLRGLLEGWRGKKFDANSIRDFVPKKLVGLTCRLSLIENGDFTNVDSIAPATAEETKAMPPPFNQPIFLSLDEEFNQETFNQLHEKTKEKISQSPEYRQLMDGPSQTEPEHQSQPEASDEDVPF